MSHKVITDAVKSKANAVREQVKESIDKYIVSITTDHWTSNSNHNYQGITMHWIDDEWKLHSVPVGCFLHEGISKSGALVEELFARMIDDIGFDELNINAVIIDFTSSLNKFGKIIEGMTIL